jgi:Ran GTPase-activating protein (RanGAP) involved in mRNA processing and transport
MKPSQLISMRNPSDEESLKRLKDDDESLTELDMSRHALDGLFIFTYFTSALMANTRLQALCLSKNHFTADQVATLATALEGNVALLSLVLEDNGLGPDSAVEVARILRRTALKTLNLAGNRILDEGAKAIADALPANSTLTSLNLEYNDITSVGVESVSQALMQNSSLEELSLASNDLRFGGMEQLADALAVNQTLVTLDLDSTLIVEADLDVLVKALRSPNSKVMTISIDGNGFAAESVEMLEKAVRRRRQGDSWRNVFWRVRALFGVA